MAPANTVHSELTASSTDSAWNLLASLLLLLLLLVAVVVVVVAVVLSPESTHFVECRAVKKMKHSPLLNEKCSFFSIPNLVYSK